MSLPAAMLLLSTFILSTTLYIHIIFRRRRNPTPPPPPPGPRGLPIVGYLPFLTPNLHQLFLQMSLDYGPIFKLSVGRKLLVVVSSPTLAKEILRDHDVTFANRNPSIAARTFSYGGKDIAFSPYGPEWRMLRKVFVQNMQSRKVLEASYRMRKDVLRKTVMELYGGGRIDVGQVAFTIVIGMISRMFWGETLDGDDHVVGKEFRSTAAKLVEVLGRPNVSDFFPVLARFDLQGIEKEMKKVSGGMEKIFDFVIDRCIEKKKKKSRLVAEDDGQRQDFLHFLLELRDDDTGTPISRQQIKAMFMDIVVGGTDTSSTTIEWVMSELILNPESMKRVQHELTEVIKPDSVVEESDISNLPFLHAVVKETLRLHPVAPLLLPRSPTESCHVGGYTIPEGAKVFLNVWAMHRDPDYWTNPSSFCPGRFVNENGTKHSEGLDYMGNNFHYLPFGSGRRFCAGFQLGEKMVMYVLATFLHMFDWEVPEDVVADTEEKFGVVLEKVTPLILIPSPRLSNSNFYCS